MRAPGMEAKPQREFKSLSWHGLGLLLVSAAVLCFEVNLTRLLSISQFFHFDFMVVSIAVLRFGASGTYLALRKEKPGKQEMLLLPQLAAGAGISILGSFLCICLSMFDSFRIAFGTFPCPAPAAGWEIGTVTWKRPSCPC